MSHQPKRCESCQWWVQTFEDTGTCESPTVGNMLTIDTPEALAENPDADKVIYTKNVFGCFFHSFISKGVVKLQYHAGAKQFL